MIKKELISIIEKKDRTVLLFSFLLKRIRDINNGSDIFNQLWNLLEMNCDFFSVRLSNSESHLYLGYYINTDLDLSHEIEKTIANLTNTVFSIIPDYIIVQPVKNNILSTKLSRSDSSLGWLIKKNLKIKFISVTNLLINKNITVILRDLKGIRGLNIALGVENINEKVEYSLILELTSNSEMELTKIENNLIKYLKSNNFINGTINILGDKIIKNRPIQTYLGISDQKLEMTNMVSILHSIVHLIDVDDNGDIKTIVPRQWLGFIHNTISNQDILDKGIINKEPIIENQLESTEELQDTQSRSLLTKEELEGKLFSYLNDVKFTRLPSCSKNNSLICLLINSIHFEFLLVPNFNFVKSDILLRDIDFLDEEKLFFIITGDPRVAEEYAKLDHIIYINNFEDELLI
jgi:hypothetical protein